MSEGERRLSRDELRFHVEQALRKGRKLWPRKRVPGDVDRYRPLAEEIAAHLALCGVRCVQGPPSPPPSTPEAGAGDGAASGRAQRPSR